MKPQLVRKMNDDDEWWVDTASWSGQLDRYTCILIVIPSSALMFATSTWASNARRHLPYSCPPSLCSLHLEYTLYSSPMLFLHLLPFLSLAAALPHTKPEKKSLSIAFTQRSVQHSRASPLEGRIRKRQGATSGDDQAELLNDNNVRCVESAV